MPNADEANDEGIVGFTTELSLERVMEAYPKGIFPWYEEGEPVIWWSPDPRFVLLPAELKVSKSMRKVMRDEVFDFSINAAFEQVVENCRNIKRANQNGTWITDEVCGAYYEMYRAGYAMSVEVWYDKELVGGFYGVWVGKVFCGESMFARMSNASKAGLIWFVQRMGDNLKLIDCQVYTEHFQSLGAQMIPRNLFLQILATQRFAPKEL